jgi:hypothetical protein
MNVGDGVPRPVDLAAGGEDCLVVRPAAEIEVRSLPPGGAAFIAALAEGRTLADSAEVALAEDGRFDISVNLAGLLSAGALVGIALGAAGAETGEPA